MIHHFFTGTDYERGGGCATVTIPAPTPAGGGSAADVGGDLVECRPDHRPVRVGAERIEVPGGGIEVCAARHRRSRDGGSCGQVEVQRRVEPAHLQARVVLPGAVVGEGIGRVERADVPHQRLRRIVVQIGEVVRERAPVEGIPIGVISAHSATSADLAASASPSRPTVTARVMASIVGSGAVMGTVLSL